MPTPDPIDLTAARKRAEAARQRADTPAEPLWSSRMDVRTLATDVIALAAEVERLRAGWQPIATAPKDETRLMISLTRYGSLYIGTGYYRPPDMYSRYPRWVCEGMYSSADGDPTHWMPLPPPPTEPA